MIRHAASVQLILAYMHACQCAVLYPAAAASPHQAAPGEEGAGGTEEQWLPMPDGRWYHRSCVHHHADGFELTRTKDEVTVREKGLPVAVLPPCPFTARSASQPRSATEAPLYYSDWSVYAQHVEASKQFSGMTSVWAVPPKPKNRGPAGLSAVYFFNGLEDGGGQHGNATLILQPVLQHGRSGCLIDPLAWADWHLGAYLVDGNGRAHCGRNFKVNPGDSVLGNMTQTDVATNTWLVQAQVMGGTTSSYSASLGVDKIMNAAYITLEGMVIYNCGAYPPGNGTTFSANSLVDGSGAHVASPLWVPMLRHQDCAQSVRTAGNGDVTLIYDASN